ncbi:RHS repeat protein [Flavobacterium salilacus subsp. salilacus]|uniref:RHS repeat domain-containing protein n=1 Tax=Flavobacterium TaxID=237 RepID=UPI001074A0CF|nr:MULTISPECIES: RHS repeat domain-containing protein [Flavobacterium]KAF2514151.1 RHS repeat protein [Flavobacterium salilacus subsp. salilacus]MBE1615190.1 RHS repeat protein [Flavobacterium sp. SaA2.13]
MKQLFLSSLLLFSIAVLGQSGSNNKQAPTLPEIIPPSPTVANLMTFEEVPVDYYTGQPDISIPIYSKKLNGDMTLPLALKYNTQGVRVASRSGWTGTGWSLEAGGSISRTVRGTADEAYKRAINGDATIQTGIYNLPHDEFFLYNTMPTDLKQRYAWNAKGTSQNVYDSELDLYQFSILGATGRFVIVKELGMLKAKLLTKDQNVAIEVFYTEQIITDGGTGTITGVTSIDGFSITDANGYKYRFGNTPYNSNTNAVEVTTSKPVSSSIPQVGEGAPDFILYNRTTVCNSAWHLTSINANNGEELVNFTYTAISEEYRELPVHTYYNITPHPGTSHYFTPSGSPAVSEASIAFNSSMTFPKYTYSQSTTTVQTKKLSQISFRDKTYIKFDFTGGHPEYEEGGITLKSISLHKSSSPNKWKTFTFAYSTINSRLWLDKVTEATVHSPTDPNHSLDYKLEYVSKDLPSYGAGDKWGFKGVTSTPTTTASEYREAFKDGVLKRIVYPTGGVKDFEFESHTYSYEGPNLISKTYTDYLPINRGASQNTQQTFEVLNNTTTPSSPLSFSLQESQTVSIDVNVQEGTAYKQYFSVKIDGQYYLISDISGGTITTGLSAGSHTITVISNGYSPVLGAPQPPPGAYIRVHLKVNYQGPRPVGWYYKRYALGGGLRIKSIIFRENENTTDSEKTISYYYNTPYDAESAENIEGNITMLPELEPTGSILQPIGQGDPFDPNILSSGATDGRAGGLGCEYTVQDETFVKSPLNGNCDVATLNFTVSTTQHHNQLTKGSFVNYKHVRVRETGKGYTYYQYQTPQDEDVSDTYGRCKYPFNELENIDYKRGWLLKKQVFNEQNQLLVEEINTYELREENIVKTRPVSSTTCAWLKLYDTYEQYAGTLYSIEQDCYGNYSIPPNCGAFPLSMSDYKWLVAGSAPLKTKIKKEYFIDGTEVAMTQTQTDYEYNPVNYQVSSETVTVGEGTETVTYKTEYQYPVGGYTASLFTTQENSTIGLMVNHHHVINKPIVTATYRNNDPLQKTINKYTVVSGLPVLKEIETLKGNITTLGEDRIVYHEYDDFGNPLDVSMKDGTHVSYIWGYNNTFPAAKIEDVAYNDIPSTLIENIINATNPVGFSESNLIAAQDALRAYYEQPGSTVMVTTLVYEPTRGVVTSVTDPRGDILRYEYDNLGRLLTVKDKDNYLLSRNEYHYRTEQ